jgi:hypothetical protein
MVSLRVIFGLVYLFSSSVAFSATQEIAAECTTKETGGDGARNGCDSDVTRITAPDNHVFAEKTLAGGEVSGNGSEHECRFNWADYVEVIPDTKIMQPRTMTLQAHALSPKGHFSGRGWAKCKFSVELTKYK